MANKSQTKKKSYFSRFQTKRRRRREAKTDYTHRRNMLRPCLKNYAVKSRLVVRRTNSEWIAQIVKSYMDGDRVIASAYSSELADYGIKVGFTNYSAAYATGLLLARRALKVMDLDKVYSAEDRLEETEDIEGERRAYRVYLDIGLARATKGGRVFAVMKGANDGGLCVPHSPKIFPGYEEDNFDSEMLRNRIYGKTVADYMTLLKDDPEKYDKQFSQYKRLGIEPEDLVKMYEQAFEKIKNCPIEKVKVKKDYSGLKKFKVQKMTSEEKKKKVKQALKEIKSN
ncbi:60S ribosomal protein L5 [Dictyocoela muelleri]|nr:60S ribosomal protein L5 [Dictyocoela muelleri]